MVKVVQNTDIRGFTIPELFSSLENLGFDGVDCLIPIRNLYLKPKQVLTLSKRYKLPILSIHQPKLLVVMHPKIFFQRMLKTINYFPNLQISNYHLSGFVNILSRNPKAVMQFIRLAKKNKSMVTFESNNKILTSLRLYPKSTYQPEKFAQFCIQHELPMTLDTSHVADNGYDIVTFFKKYHSKIKLIHLSDYENEIEHLPLGMGSLPIIQLLRDIKKTKWNGIIVFEITKFPGARSKSQKIKMLKDSLQIVRKYTS